MGVEARGQQEQQHDQQRGQPVAGQAPRQQIATEPAKQKKQVRQDMAGQIDVARVFQPQDPFRQQKQGQLQGRAVEAVMELQQGWVPMQDIIEGVDGDKMLASRIRRDAVVIDDGEACKEEQGACNQCQTMKSGPFSDAICHRRHAVILPL